MKVIFCLILALALACATNGPKTLESFDQFSDDSVDYKPFNYTLPEGWVSASAAYLDGGFIFIVATKTSTGDAWVVALNNLTYQFAQAEPLSFPCFYPQWFYRYNVLSVVCSTAEDTAEGSPAAAIVKPIDGIFFSISLSQTFTTSSTGPFQIISYNNLPYIWYTSSSSIYYIYGSVNYLYIYTYVYDFQAWTTDLNEFNWTSLAISTGSNGYTTLSLTGYLQNIDVLAVLDASGRYSLYEGSFGSVAIFPAYKGTGKVFGYTLTAATDADSITMGLWDFTQGSAAKPTLIQEVSLSAGSVLTTTPYHTFFVSYLGGALSNSAYKYSASGVQQMYTWGEDLSVNNVFADSQYFYAASETEVYAWPYNN